MTKWRPGKGDSANIVKSLSEMGAEPIPFGKHKGERLDSLSDGYVDWLLEQEWFEEEYSNQYLYLETNREQS